MLAEACAARKLLRHEHQLEVARQAAATSESSDEIFLLAEAHYQEGIALRWLGRLDEAELSRFNLITAKAARALE